MTFTQKGEGVKKDAKLLTNNIDFAGIEDLRGKEIKKTKIMWASYMEAPYVEITLSPFFNPFLDTILDHTQKILIAHVGVISVLLCC